MNQRHILSPAASSAALSPAPDPSPTAGGARPVGLDQVPPGCEAVLANIEAAAPLKHRLAEMGLRPGVRLVVLGAGRPRPFMLGIGDTRLVLGSDLGACVRVYLVKR